MDTVKKIALICLLGACAPKQEDKYAGLSDDEVKTLAIAKMRAERIKNAPPIGAVDGDWRFNGGDPADRANWTYVGEVETTSNETTRKPIMCITSGWLTTCN